jgi:hypothetical protein
MPEHDSAPIRREAAEHELQLQPRRHRVAIASPKVGAEYGDAASLEPSGKAAEEAKPGKRKNGVFGTRSKRR